MDMNIIVAGVGGQGILSIAFVLDNAAMKAGFHFKQAEVHGMSQRGGAVQSHIRFSTEEIWSDLIPEGSADMILSVEPLESLRYFHYLKPEGAVVASSSPFVNIPDYPDTEDVYRRIAALPRHVLIDSEALARRAGSNRAQNMVMLGAAAHLLPFRKEVCLDFVELLFKSKGEKAVRCNQHAFQYGEQASAFYRAGMEAGIDPVATRFLGGVLDPERIEVAAIPIWKQVLEKHPGLLDGGIEEGMEVPGTVEAAKMVLEKGAWPT
jgi:indolepyruvate ferredoxin oxidoreductase beta subunit